MLCQFLNAVKGQYYGSDLTLYWQFDSLNVQPFVLQVGLKTVFVFVAFLLVFTSCLVHLLRVGQQIQTMPPGEYFGNTT